MAIKRIVTERLRKNTWRAFLRLAKERGVSPCKFYPAAVRSSTYVERNLYHDVVEDTGPGTTSPAIDTFIYIDMIPPLKTVKAAGWWKEGETLPIIAYMPYRENTVPEKGCKIIVPEGEGYMSGTWVVTQEKMYGQDVPIVWMCTIVADRNSGVTL